MFSICCIDYCTIGFSFQSQIEFFCFEKGFLVIRSIVVVLIIDVIHYYLSIYYNFSSVAPAVGHILVIVPFRKHWALFKHDVFSIGEDVFSIVDNSVNNVSMLLGKSKLMKLYVKFLFLFTSLSSLRKELVRNCRF